VVLPLKVKVQSAALRSALRERFETVDSGFIMSLSPCPNPVGPQLWFMKTRSISLLVVCGLLTVISSAALANVTLDQAQSAPAFSGAINDVVKLHQSGVELSVVLSYVKTSSGPFQPSADEIVKLRDIGISSQVITAVLERGGELRQQTATTPSIDYAAYSRAASAPATVAQPAATYAQPATYVQPVTYAEPVYTAPPVSSVVVIGSSYAGYGYPFSYGYRSSYCYRPSYYSHSYYPHVGFYAGFPHVSFGLNFGGSHFHGSYHHR
jgi:hypothetical protein